MRGIEPAFDRQAPAQVTPAPMPPPSHDWHALVIVPFGTLLKDVPYRLSEVVLSTMPRVPAPVMRIGIATPCREPSRRDSLGGRSGSISLCFSSDRLIESRPR